MAGAGWRSFPALSTLTSAQVQTYLQDQTVQVYANAAARSSALGTSVSQGMVSFDKSVNERHIYDGSAWTKEASPKNVIINGGFDFWQRGTSVTPVAAFGFGPDRWQTYSYSTSTSTISQQSFSPGAAPVTGYESQYFVRVNSTNSATYLSTRIEDVRTFAGQTVTLSYWTKSGTLRSDLSVQLNQVFGSGGSTTVTTNLVGSGATSTTSWVRYSYSVTLPSISGKTIGSGNYLELAFQSATINNTLDIWGVQLEAGSVATLFSRAGGTLQGEKAACQRYYWRATALGSNDGILPTGTALSSTQVIIHGFHPTSMRTYTSSFDFSNIRLFDGVTVFAVTAVTSSFTNPDTYALILTCAGGLTQYRPYVVLANAGTSYFGANAEL